MQKSKNNFNRNTSKADYMSEKYNMSKNIKDYLHFYLNCECMFTIYETEYHAIFKGINDDYVTLKSDGNKASNHYLINKHLMNVKPILRPLSDMTEEELNECGNLVYDFSDEPELNKWNYKDFTAVLASEQFIWLLSKHFDLFNLIEEELAIDATQQSKGE